MKDADKIISGALGILESDPIEKSIKEQSNVPRLYQLPMKMILTTIINIKEKIFIILLNVVKML